MNPNSNNPLNNNNPAPQPAPPSDQESVTNPTARPTALHSKTCTKCGRTFQATTTHFHPAATGLHGLRAACRACTNATERKGYKTRRDIIEFQETGHHYIPYYRTCAQCGQTFPRSKTYFPADHSNRTHLASRCLYCTSSTEPQTQPSAYPPHNPPLNPQPVPQQPSPATESFQPEARQTLILNPNLHPDPGPHPDPNPNPVPNPQPNS